MNYIKNLEKNLTKDQKDILKHIYEPTVVATPLADSRRDICILPDGEIRSYGRLYSKKHGDKTGQVAYLSSKDCGLSWSINYSHSKMNSCTYMEKGDVYINVCEKSNNYNGIEEGLYVMRSKIGPDDENPEIIKVSDKPYADSFLPKQSQYTNRIWFTAQIKHSPAFFYSDDFGLTWTIREIPNPNNFEIVFPHKGLRWCKKSGTEPNVIEISKNNMMMIIRTPMDCFYKSYSKDGGDSWSAPEPTNFYGTNTTAYLLKLSDGRIINFWNNTKPLSQPNLKNTLGSTESVIEGYGENAFTNRDAAHAAISLDGGKTFKGYREIILNPIRNNSDFRYIGGVNDTLDKSVHQFQAFELPFNKVLVSAGQNAASRRILIFDVDWLCETNRKEDFLSGMKNVTSHTYLKSVSGSHYAEVGNGHCSWNRIQSAYPFPDTEDTFGEVILVSKYADDRKINDISGICWNFPLSKKGRVSVKIKILEKQARFILSDRWYNVCDMYAAYQSPFFFELDKLDTGDGYADIDIDYDVNNKMAQVKINGEFAFKVKMNVESSVGLCYLLLQCACDGDSKGFCIKSIEKCDLN
ncbi:MAG: exo-alpha-sialidase [Ruminococcaceae bacterium]|nr:exo-alpha-sialidase [Oscillospiraceae bacterium]